MTELIAIFLVAFGLRLGPPSIAQAPGIEEGEAAPPPNGVSTPVLDSLNDGPHVYWESPMTAIVFYYCDRRSARLAERIPTTDDTLSFRGRCDDRSIEYVVPEAAPLVEEHILDDVSRIFAVSDIHGEYEAFAQLLYNAGIIDDNLRWRWGDGHLVITGDVFDRGDRVSECLWLIYRLEQEAARAGGRVHYTLGNHEMMVMRGDLRYVNPKYSSGIVAAFTIPYDDLYGPGMEMGRWLRTKHVAVKLNDIVFVHGGLSLEAVERDLSLAELNTLTREIIDLRSYDIVFNQTWSFIDDAAGPLWFRGYHYGREGWYDQVSREEFDRILEYYDASAIVVGHTDIGTLQSLYDGRLFGIDVSVEELGSLQGLLWEDDIFYRVTGTGLREPLVQMR